VAISAGLLALFLDPLIKFCSAETGMADRAQEALERAY